MRALVCLLVAAAVLAVLSSPLSVNAESIAQGSLQHGEASVQSRSAPVLAALKARLASSDALLNPAAAALSTAHLTPAQKKKLAAAKKKAAAAKAAKAKANKSKAAKATNAKARGARKPAAAASAAAKKRAGRKPAANNSKAKRSPAAKTTAKKAAAKGAKAPRKAAAGAAGAKAQKKGGKAPVKGKLPRAPRGKRNGTKLAKGPKALKGKNGTKVAKGPKGRNGTKLARGPKAPKGKNATKSAVHSNMIKDLKALNSTGAKGPKVRKGKTGLWTNGTYAQALEQRLDVICIRFPKNKRCVKRAQQKESKANQDKMFDQICPSNPNHPECKARVAARDATAAISTKNDDRCMGTHGPMSPECTKRLNDAKAIVERMKGQPNKFGGKGALSTEEAAKAIELLHSTKVLKMERLRLQTEEKLQANEMARKAAVAPLQAQLAKLTPGTPEHKAKQLEIINVEVKHGVKANDLTAVQGMEAKRLQADAVNGAKAVLERPKEVKKFTKAECAKDPKCPLHTVKDFQGKDITQQVHNAFEGGKFEQKTYDRPVTLYRCTNGERDEKQGAGSWWSRTMPKDSEETRKRLAISKDWGSAPLRKCYSMTVPAGKPMVEGTAGAQKDSTAKGGIVRGLGQQTFFPDADESLMNQAEVPMDEIRYNAAKLGQAHGEIKVTEKDVIIK